MIRYSHPMLTANQIFPDPDGEYVKWEDVKAALRHSLEVATIYGIIDDTGQYDNDNNYSAESVIEWLEEWAS